MHHYLAQAILAGADLAIVLGILAALIRTRAQQLHFAGPLLDGWQQARSQLRHTDQWRVIWATRRNHPTRRATLAGAQLAYARYLHDAAQRALHRRQWQRVVVPVILGLVATGFAVLAVTQRQSQIFGTVYAALFAFCALFWLSVPRSLRRLTERMARLQAEIENRNIGKAPNQP